MATASARQDRCTTISSFGPTIFYVRVFCIYSMVLKCLTCLNKYAYVMSRIDVNGTHLLFILKPYTLYILTAVEVIVGTFAVLLSFCKLYLK